MDFTGNKYYVNFNVRYFASKWQGSWSKRFNSQLEKVPLCIHCICLRNALQVTIFCVEYPHTNCLLLLC
jgi:hypothetical protein